MTTHLIVKDEEPSQILMKLMETMAIQALEQRSILHGEQLSLFTTAALDVKIFRASVLLMNSWVM